MSASAPNPLLAVYLERRGDLLRHFRARLRSDAAAEDLVQDIYLKIASPPESEISNPAAYLFRLGDNLMLDRIKVQRRAGRRDALWRDINTSGPGEGVVEGSPADDAADARLRLARIIEVVADLPPPVREAFRLHKLEGLTHAETARAMNVSKSSVEKYMMTCLKRILARVER